MMMDAARDMTGAGDAGESLGGVMIAPGVRVAWGVLRFAYSRSGGPGGQNVNKVSTKAELRIDVEAIPISGRARSRLRKLAGRRIAGATTEVNEFGASREVGGELIIASETERSQSGTREECLERLRELIVQALVEPKPRRKTKPTRGSVERRITEKKRRSDVKERRRDSHD
jgi:ribosome-associated protein